MNYSIADNRQANHIEQQHWLPDNIIEIEPEKLLRITETICTQCRYPLLALRLLIHIICAIDADWQITISTRRLATMLGLHYDTVTKCLKYLREIEVLTMER